MRRLLTSAACLAIFLVADFLNAQSRYTQVGLGSAGQVAFEYVGVVLQDGANFEAFGYLTYVRDVPDELLFFDLDDRNETTARFTFHSRSRMTSRSLVDKLFSVNVKGDLTVYLRNRPDESASLQRGDQFVRGNRLAVFDFRGQSNVAVTSPNFGVNTAVLEAKQSQKGWQVFQLSGKEHVFGRPSALMRFTHTGRGERSQEEPPIARIAIAGHVLAVADSKN